MNQISHEQRITQNPRDKILVVEWVKQYLIDCQARQLSKGTVDFYRRKLNIFLKYCKQSEVLTIQDITPAILRSFLIEMEKEGHNEGGIHAFYRSIKSFLLWYEEEAEPENWKNPVKKVKPPRQVEALIEPVSNEDVSSILQAFDNNTTMGLRNTAMVMMLFDTGLRANEMLNITLEDIDLVAGSVKVMGKGRKARTVFMGQKCRKAVRAYLKKREYAPGYLFLDRSHRGKIDYTGLRSMLRRACDRAGIDCPPVHSFRRAYALTMLRNGADVYTLQKLMGHADLQVLRRYLKQTDEDLELVHRRASPLDHSEL